MPPPGGNLAPGDDTPRGAGSWLLCEPHGFMCSWHTYRISTATVSALGFATVFFLVDVTGDDAKRAATGGDDVGAHSEGPDGELIIDWLTSVTYWFAPKLNATRAGLHRYVHVKTYPTTTTAAAAPKRARARTCACTAMCVRVHVREGSGRTRTRSRTRTHTHTHTHTHAHAHAHARTRTRTRTNAHALMHT